MSSAGKNYDKTHRPLEDETKPSGLRSYLRLFRYADNKSRCLYAASAVAAIAAGVALPFMDIVFGKFVTAFNDFAVGALSPAEYMSKVEDFTLYFVYLFVAKFVLVYVHSLGASIAAIRTTKALRMKFLKTLLCQDMTYFDSRQGGSPAMRITTNGNLINNGISDKLSLTVQCTSTFVSAFIIALITQWKLTLICICILPTIILTMGVSGMIDVKQEAAVMSFHAKASLLAEEVFTNIATVHAFWLQPLMSNRYDALLAEAEHYGLKKSLNWGVSFSSQFFCIYAGYGLAFWQGIRLWASGEIAESGKIVTVIFALLVAATSMMQISAQLLTLTKAATAADELFGTINTESLSDPLATSGLRPEQCFGHIEFEGVDFAYPSRPDNTILRGLTLSIPAKKKTALVGASGSGKSTIVALLERWYDQSAGSILLDGISHEKLNLRWLRTNVRLVQQEPVLFSGTIFDNVAHGLLGTENETASHEKKMQLVQNACENACAHGFIQRLPDQYLTKIGERARMLSGGQKQRIAIARSIVSDPPILLLDEATSALDPSAEKVVQEALDNASVNRTTITIAHKLSTIRKADNIVVLSHGVLVEQGTHRDLLAKEGVYAKLVHSQDLKGTESPRKESNDPSDEGDQEFPSDTRGSQYTSPIEKAVSSVASIQGDASEGENVTAQGMGYGLLRCLYLLVREQPQLWHLYTIVGVTAIFGGGSLAVHAVLFGRTMSVFQLTGSERVSQGDFWALMFFVVALANLALYFAMAMSCNTISQKVTHIYRLETFKNTINQKIAFFDDEVNAAGAITSRLSRCTNDLQEVLSVNAGLVLNNIVTVISCAVLGISYGWKLGLVCTFGALPPLLLGGYFGIRLSTQLGDDTTKRFAQSAAVASEAVASIRTVASLTLEQTVLDNYERQLSEVASKSAASLGYTMFWYSLTQSVNFLAMALGFWYGGRLVASGEYSHDQFFIVFVAVVLGGENAAQMSTFTTSISKATAAANYIFFLRTTVPPDGGGDGSTPDDTTEQDKAVSITCDSLGFAYLTRSQTSVLKDVNVRIPAGGFVAFVGSSGCGKSTMIALLSRFYDPTSGVISVNDQPITDVSPRTHRRRIAMVQQEPVLYTGSIRENVEMGVAESRKATEAQVVTALEAANILDFVRSLPEGLDTYLGNRGDQLSGGQRQRIAIARALIRDPKILLLDEATSALDTESEKAVQTALSEAAKDGGRTTVAVAHRLTTVKDADVIFVFREGRVVEAGNHAALLARKGTYFEMCRGQALDQAV